MATAILSTAIAYAGFAVPADALLGIAALGYCVLAVRYALGPLGLPARFGRDLRQPDRAFGSFTFPAASTLLGERFHQLGLHGVGLGMVALGGISWLALAYAVPAATILRAAKAPFAESVGGTWLLWVVATESVATGTSMAALGQPQLRGVLVPAAATTWAVGIVLYLVLITALLMRLLVLDVAAQQLSPTYWIGMGATAITTLAGARLLQLADGLPLIRFEGPAIGGLTFLLWAAGTFWVPLLAIGTCWRAARGPWRRRYDPALWSLVFPLGMYSEASAEFGTASHLGFIAIAGKAMLVPAVVAWIVVSILFAATFRK